ncbi:polysaccharide biosynthesis tyrosine autokinase [Brevibacterium sp. JSBI002]|uniref:polysaccharide biosynthesis tyrosine autokinase n=1 Tax=Brevibacterium sp. JSBI002 TaxID=2886045 RepID=UPI0022314FB8|nr:polysaccharide biosynthesis tyrosine autokinase [Brevibacterium sp. JSBI002]UZD62015.1 polysaccharide biosynthesis tyrosine autokinase [Brevibacterium sp. JSBI002]
MSIVDYVRILRKNAVLLSVMITVGGLCAGAAFLLQPREYTSQTELFVSTVEAANPDQKQIASAFVQERLRTYVDLANSRKVLEPVIRELSLDFTPVELDDKVSASSDHGTVLLTVDATAASPGQAALLSESVANNLTKTITDLESRHGKAQSGIRLAVANDAIVPVSPDGPAWWLYVTIGMLLGAALGIAGALFRSAVDSKIREISGIREITNAPILGSLPMHSDSSSRTGLPALRQDTPYDEAIRRLRTNLRFVRVEDSSNILAVTSSIPSEGKTSTCIELAVSLAQSGQRVALVDVDLRQPAVADRLGLENSAGLTTALVGAADVHDLLQPWGQDELYVLTAGDSVANPVELIESRAMAKLMAVLGNDFDTVLLDCPPVLPVTDGLLLAKSAGRIVHVVAVNQASRNELDEALQDLSVVDTPLSLVVNKVPLGHADLNGYTVSYTSAPQERTAEPQLVPSGGRSGHEHTILAERTASGNWMSDQLGSDSTAHIPRRWPVTEPGSGRQQDATANQRSATLARRLGKRAKRRSGPEHRS